MGQEVTVWFSQEDLFRTAGLFKNHREWIQYQFNKVGVEVTQFENKYNKTTNKIESQGLKVGRGGSELDMRISMTVVIGKNARYLNDPDKESKTRAIKNAAGD